MFCRGQNIQHVATHVSPIARQYGKTWLQAPSLKEKKFSVRIQIDILIPPTLVKVYFSIPNSNPKISLDKYSFSLLDRRIAIITFAHSIVRPERTKMTSR